MEEKPFRYLLFGGQFYYAKGGMWDYIGAFNTASDAMYYGKQGHDKDHWDWYHVVNLQASMITGGTNSQAHGGW